MIYKLNKFLFRSFKASNLNHYRTHSDKRILKELQKDILDYVDKAVVFLF